MILSNEPGYYKNGSFGIRIENLQLVVEAHIAHAARPMNRFEALTLAPIDRRLILRDMLSHEEIDWLNAYHRRIENELASYLDDATRAWLTEATAPL